MKKIRWVLLNIIGLGIPYIYARNKANKLKNTTNTTLQTSSLIDFDITDLLNALGGKDNIENISTTISTLKVNLKNAQDLSKEQFNKFKINGFMKNQKQIILVFGDNAQAIGNELSKLLN